MTEHPPQAQVVLNDLSDEDLLRATARSFAALGFQTDLPFAGSFTISGPPELFRRHFGSVPGTSACELRLDALPAALRPAVRAVVTTAPPDFGPAGDGP